MHLRDDAHAGPCSIATGARSAPRCCSATGAPASIRRRAWRGSNATSPRGSRGSRTWWNPGITSRIASPAPCPRAAARAWHHVGNVQSVRASGRRSRVRGRDRHLGVGDRRRRRGAGAGLRRRRHHRSVGLVTSEPASAPGLRSLRVDGTHASARRSDAGRRRLRALVPRRVSRTRHAGGRDRAHRSGRCAKMRRSSCPISPASARPCGRAACAVHSTASTARMRRTTSCGARWRAWRTRCDILRLAEAGAGHRPREIRACGGGAQSDAWCALKADVLRIPVIRSRAAETGLVGAAMAAAVGLGWLSGPAAGRGTHGEARPAVHAACAGSPTAYARRAATYAAIKRYALELVDDT